MDFTWNEIVLKDGSPGKALKLQADHFEVNVWFSLKELELLKSASGPSWDGKSIQVGSSADAPAWWSRANEDVFLLVGADDQTWDIGVSIPLSFFEKIVAEQNDT